MDLKDFKSLRVVEDPKEIQAILRGDGEGETTPEGDPLFYKRLSITSLNTEEKVVLPSAEQIEELARGAGLDFQPGMEKRVIPFWASDERVDRDGDIIRQNWNLAEFNQNPVILFGHDWFSPPIGSSLITEVRDRIDGDFQGRALFMLLIFATEDVSPMADSVFRLLKSGFLKTASVGFFPGRVTFIEDDEERARLGLGRWGKIFDDNKLIELSIVTVPANPGAHVIAAAKSAGVLRAEDFTTLREIHRRRIISEGGDVAVWLKDDASLVYFWKQMFKTVKIAPHTDLQQPCSADEVIVREWVNLTSSESEGKDALKAFPNEHACRVRDPDDFEEDSFRRITEETDDGKEFAIIIGKLKGEDETTAQAFRYPISDWTEAEAKERCDNVDGTFEAAEPEEEGDHEDDEDEDEDDKALRRLSELVGESVGKALTPLSDQIRDLNSTIQTLVGEREVEAEIASTTTEDAKEKEKEEGASAVRGLLEVFDPESS